MNRTIRILLVDHDAMFRQKVVAELAEEDIQVDTAALESELLEQLQSFRGQHELVLLGQLEGPPRGKEILSNIRQQYPNIELITLTNSEMSRQPNWILDPVVYCGADRQASREILALMIKSAVRYKLERVRSQALQALVSAVERMGAIKTEEQLYQELYEGACELLPGLDGFMIAHYDEQASEVSFPFAYKHNRRIHIQARRGGKSIAEYVVLTKEPLLLPYGDEMFRLQHGLNPPDDNLGYSRSELVVPMLLEGRKIYGLVFASTNDPKIRYTEEHRQVLTTFSNQAVLSIRNFVQITEANQLRDATAALAGQHGREGILRAIIEGAHKIVNSDFTGLILVDEQGCLQKAQPVIPEHFFYKFGDPRQEGGLTRTIVTSRQPQIIPNTAKDPLVKESVRAEGIKSMLALPLIHRDRVLGVLFTHTFKPRDFVARDVALWSAFATQAASALDRVIEEERRIRDYQRLERELAQLDESLSLKETLEQVATAAKAVFDSDTCRLFYIDPLTGKVVDNAWAEGDSVEYHVESTPRRDGTTHHVLRTKKPYYYPDMTDGPSPRSELLAAGLKSHASLPLRYGGRNVGVLHCNYFTQKPAYNEHYKTLLAAFGERAAVVLNRAARQHKAEIWRGLDGKIFECTEVQQLYQLFTEKAHEALGADFSLFYPYDLKSKEPSLVPLEEGLVRVGGLVADWRRPRGGRRGRVIEELSRRRSMLIVNDLDNRSGRFASHLSHREKVRAFVAMRLHVNLPEAKEPRLAGILFVNFRQPTALKEADLRSLRSARKLFAAGILRLRLQAELQQSFKQRNDQLRAVIEIFRTQESKNLQRNLDHIAEQATRALGLDVCTIIEFDAVSQKFTHRGSFGLRHPEYLPVTPRSKFKDAYMYREGPTIIPDVRRDLLMRASLFVRREGIRSTVVCPLLAEGELLGLLFANYRTLTEPTQEGLEALCLFADMAAHGVHQTILSARLNEQRSKEERRRLLVLVSLVHDMWLHTLVQKASTIRNHAYSLRKRLKLHPQLPEAMASAPEIISEIDRLAADIANAPPRMPSESEMRRELIPIGPLLQEIVERELSSIRLQGGPVYEYRMDLKALGGVQVHGYRRWLIYAFECLLQNAYAAMPKAGQITITGSKQKGWVELRICDTGKGVPLELRDKLFNEPITGRHDYQGLGIGSTLVKTLVEESDGYIELEKPGPGDTTVLIRLPIGRQAKKG